MGRLVLLLISALCLFILWQSNGPWSVLNVMILFVVGMAAIATKGFGRLIFISLFAIGTYALWVIFNPWALVAIPIPWVLAISLMPASKKDCTTQSGDPKAAASVAERAKEQHSVLVPSRSSLEKTHENRGISLPRLQPNLSSTSFRSLAGYGRAKSQFHPTDIPEGRYARQFFWEKMYGFIGRDWRSH